MACANPKRPPLTAPVRAIHTTMKINGFPENLRVKMSMGRSNLIGPRKLFGNAFCIMALQ